MGRQEISPASASGSHLAWIRSHGDWRSLPGSRQRHCLRAGFGRQGRGKRTHYQSPGCATPRQDQI